MGGGVRAEHSPAWPCTAVFCPMVKVSPDLLSQHGQVHLLPTATRADHCAMLDQLAEVERAGGV